MTNSRTRLTTAPAFIARLVAVIGCAPPARVAVETTSRDSAMSPRLRNSRIRFGVGFCVFCGSLTAKGRCATVEPLQPMGIAWRTSLAVGGPGGDRQFAETIIDA